MTQPSAPQAPSAFAGPVYDSVLDAIGGTPMLEAKGLDTGPCQLFLKLESQNPAGSIKDRIGKCMIEQAEKEGLIKPGGLLVEATAGNTGLGLALTAARKGYRLVIVVPDKMAQEKIFHLRALGAEVRMTRSDVGKGHPEYYQDVAERIASEENGFYVNQFANKANPYTHETTTGPEIWAQMGEKMDAMVCGVGSGGTITGLGKFFAKVAPHVEMVLADPEGSILAHYIDTGEVSTEVGSWLVEGIGEDFIPPIADLSYVKKAYTIPDEESFRVARELLNKTGMLGGSSSGTLVAAALRYCREQSEPKRVVTFVCDSGNKYLSKMYNDYWMLDQGFMAREPFGDLRDIITRRHEDRATVTCAPGDSLLAAYGRMKLYDISQLPVIDDTGAVIGILDEEDILFSIIRGKERFREPVKSAMTYRLETIDANQPLESLLGIFAKGHVAIVVSGGEFQGLITRMDLLNHLRRQLG